MDDYPKGNVPMPGSLMWKRPAPLYPSPCCGAESKPQYVGDRLTLMRCGQCGAAWKP